MGTPGQNLAKDPKGRAFMTSAIERVNRCMSSTAMHLGIEPLLHHSKRTAPVQLQLIPLESIMDMINDNPIFASLEYEYPDEDGLLEGMISTEGGAQKEVAYELVLGLNHVSRRWATPNHHLRDFSLHCTEGQKGQVVCL
jgi:splicing factor 3B subunit 3